MSELRDRLEQLAARGSRRGADDVLGAALRGTPNEEIAIVPDFDGPDLPIIGDEVPFVSAEPERRKRSRYGTVVAAFGIAALLGVGMLAITAVFGHGGASSPEGAVKQLADAISNKDPLAAVDVLSPTEVRAARQTVNSATHRAADLKIVDDASQPLAGVDLSVDHLALSTQTLADGFAKVTITGGEISASTHTAAMSKLLQQAIKDDGNPPGKVDLARLASDSKLPTFVVTVRHDGRWFVSPAYTALEYAREADGGPAAEFGSAKAAALGSDTPENTVGDTLHALQAGNWNRLMELAPPDELPVYDYRNWLSQVGSESHPDFTIDQLSTSSTINGDTATVKLEASGTTGSGSDKGTWQVGGSCPSNTFDPYGYSDSGSAVWSQTGASSPSSRYCVAGDLEAMVPFGIYMGGAGSGAPSSGAVTVEVVREDGRWFVSPVTTALEMLDSAIKHVDERTVYTMLGLAYQLPPDGTITLGQPFTPASDTGFLSASVYAFEGTKGQQVVGEIDASQQYAYASGRIYTADGKDVNYLDFATTNDGYAYPVTLPSTGSYRLIVNGPVRNGATLTLWDTKDAPKGLIQTDKGIGEHCTVSGPMTSCTSSGGIGVTTPTVAVTPLTGSVSGSTGSSVGSSRSVTETTSAGPAPTVGVATSVP